MDTTAGLLMAMATMERGLLMRSQQLMLRPNPGGMETMDTTDTLLMAMATMERDLLMPSLLQMPSLGGMEAMDMAGPMGSIGANLTIKLKLLAGDTPKQYSSDRTKMDHDRVVKPHH